MKTLNKMELKAINGGADSGGGGDVAQIVTNPRTGDRILLLDLPNREKLLIIDIGDGPDLMKF